MKQLFIIVITFLCFSVEGQQTDYVDFVKAKAEVAFDNSGANRVLGLITYEFVVLETVDSIFINANNFESIEYRLDGTIIDSLYDGKHLIIKHDFKAKTKHTLDIAWITKPSKALYFIDAEEDNAQIWSQGQGKYTSNWLPSIDDMNDKIEFDLSITYANGYEVLANGKLINKDIGESTTVWHYDMQKPMSSYLVALAIGKYNKKELTSKSGIPIKLYYYPEDSSKVEPTYRYTKQLFDFLEEEIGVPYPWQNYKQVPVKDFLYSGMENTSLTIFSDDFMIDKTSFVDKNYVNVNAHELAHQWFGNLVTETEGKHHWLQEGFATYYALLAERAVFGDDYYYWRLYEYAQELLEQEGAEQATALLDPKASSTTFYKKGAWALHMLHLKVGEAAFKKAVKNYLETYAFKNVQTEDFIAEVEKASGQDLTPFVLQWLTSAVLPEKEMRLALEKNEMTSFLLAMEESPYLSYRIDDNEGIIPSSLVHKLPDGYYPVQSAVVTELMQKPEYPMYASLVTEAFQSKELKVRQVIAQNLSEIPSELKTDYESLLEDKSYVTVETALYNLWSNFPESRKKYLDQTKDVIGFNAKNVRTLWLVLALNTQDYNEDKKREYYDELVAYTSPFYGFQLRENAFKYLEAIHAFNDVALKHLVAATTHHNWRFKSFAKELLERLSEDERYEQIIANLQTEQKK